MAPHSSTLAWKIPWTEVPGRLQSMGSLGVGHDWATSLSLFTFLHWRRKWQPTPVFLPGESQGRGAWWAAVYGVAQSRTQLKRLSKVILILIAHFQSINWDLGAPTLNNHTGLTSDISRAPSLWLQKMTPNSRTWWLQVLPGVKHFKILLASIFSIIYWNWIRSFQFWKFCISVLLWGKN